MVAIDAGLSWRRNAAGAVMDSLLDGTELEFWGQAPRGITRSCPHSDEREGGYDARHRHLGDPVESGLR